MTEKNPSGRVCSTMNIDQIFDAQGGGATVSGGMGARREREMSFTRRALLEWSLPIASLGLVAMSEGTALADHDDHTDSTGHTDEHGDESHYDSHTDTGQAHVDEHYDIDTPHTDGGDHVDTHSDSHYDHGDTGHTDHVDSHDDEPHVDHNDANELYHTDEPVHFDHDDVNFHSDVNHVDVPHNDQHVDDPPSPVVIKLHNDTEVPHTDGVDHTDGHWDTHLDHSDAGWTSHSDIHVDDKHQDHQDGPD